MLTRRLDVKSGVEQDARCGGLTTADVFSMIKIFRFNKQFVNIYVSLL